MLTYGGGVRYGLDGSFATLGLKGQRRVAIVAYSRGRKCVGIS